MRKKHIMSLRSNSFQQFDHMLSSLSCCFFFVIFTKSKGMRLYVNIGTNLLSMM